MLDAYMHDGPSRNSAAETHILIINIGVCISLTSHETYHYALNIIIYVGLHIFDKVIYFEYLFEITSMSLNGNVTRVLIQKHVITYKCVYCTYQCLSSLPPWIWEGATIDRYRIF